MREEERNAHLLESFQVQGKDGRWREDEHLFACICVNSLTLLCKTTS